MAQGMCSRVFDRNIQWFPTTDRRYKQDSLMGEKERGLLERFPGEVEHLGRAFLI